MDYTSAIQNLATDCSVNFSLNRARKLEKNPTPVVVSAVALLDSANNVFMQQRNLSSVHGGLWEFPGGKLESGETPEKAAVRELAEELGIIIPPEKLVPVGFASGHTNDGVRSLVILLYLCREWAGEPQAIEAEALGWFEISQLPQLAMPPLDYPLAAQLHGFLRIAPD